MLRWFQIVVVLGFALGLWPASAQAQAEGVAWEVTPGFDGAYKAGAWFPVAVTIENSGPDLRGTLDLRFLAGQASTFSQTIDLPHNARKRIVLPVAADSERSGNLRAELTLRSADQVVRRERINLNAIESFSLVVGAISDQSAALPELNNLLRGMGGFESVFLNLVPAQLPDRGELLQSFDLLFVHAVDTEAWTPAQRTALRDWVANGGQLIVGGDAQTVRGLVDLLPATAEERGTTSSLRGLGEGTGWPVQADAPSVTVLDLTPKPGAEVVLRGDGELPLLVRQPYGVGNLVQTAFSLDTLRDAGDVPGFWRRVLRLNVDRQSGWIDLRNQGYFTLQQALDLPELRLPSVLGFLGFLLLYIVTIGPLNYLLLRRLERREWAYFTIPLLVAVFSVGAYVWGTTGRGQAATITQLSVVRPTGDGTSGQATTFLALFSPTRGSYEVALPPAALLADLQPAWSRQGDAPVDVVYAEDSVRTPDLLVDVGGVRALSAEHQVAVPQVVATRTADNEVRVRNLSDQPIEGLVLARGDGQAQSMPALAPGQERTVTFRGDAFIQAINVAEAGRVISRQAVLQQLSTALLPALFGGAAPFPEPAVIVPGDEQSLPPDSEVIPQPADELYLLGWQAQPTLAVTLNGRPTSAAGDTLYIWPISKEQ